MALDFPDTPLVGDQYGSLGTVWRWDGSRWGSTSGASGARGVVVMATLKGTTLSVPANPTLTTIPGLTGTWVADPSRVYRTMITGIVVGTLGTGFELQVADGAGTKLYGASTNYLHSSYGTNLVAPLVETGLSGTITRKAVGSGLGGACTFYGQPSFPAQIVVEDITYEAGVSGTTTLSLSGTEVSKPATPTAGSRYYATDTKRDWLYDGTGWIIMAEPAQSYTPTTTGISFGSGWTMSGYYHRSDGYCDYWTHTNFGATSAGVLSTGPTWSLPFPSDSGEPGAAGVGWATLADATGPLIGLTPAIIGTSLVEPRYLAVVGNAVTGLGQISNTVPILIAVNDTMRIKLRYRMASRYT